VSLANYLRARGTHLRKSANFADRLSATGPVASMSALGQKRTGVLSLASQERLVKRLLDRVEHPSSRLRQIAGKVAQECSLGKSSFVAVEDNARRRGRRRKLASQGSVILFCIRSPCRDVDDSGKLLGGCRLPL